jgi:hypothetical protein
MNLMRRFNLGRSFTTVGLVSLLAAAIAGCHDGHDDRSCKDIPCGAIPQPNGAFACQWANAERGRADQDRYVIYEYEWSAEPTKLTPNGQDHVVCIARALPGVPNTVVIEPTTDWNTNEKRRAAVLNALTAAGCPTDPARVVCCRPEAEGLYGEEAGPAARGMLSGQGAQSGGGSFGTPLSGSQGATGNSGGVGGSSGGMGVY